MKTLSNVKFTTTRIKGGAEAEQARYQGQLKHNDVLTKEQTRRAFAEYCRPFHRSTTDMIINSLGEFIAREIACGRRLDFGPFQVALKLNGNFKSSNAPFDRATNGISVCLIPGKALKRATENLNPVNVTEEARWHLTGTLQRLPYEVYDRLVATGTREITVTGQIAEVHPARPDEGVWIEDDTGAKVLAATVTKSAFAHTDCTLEGSLERGDYWIVIQCRDRNSSELIRCRRRIKVIA